MLDAANLIALGHCETVVLAGGGAGIYTERASTAPWTRPSNEFVVPFGMYTALEFALIARRHMHLYGTKPEQLAEVAATIRNNGHVNPEAVYYGKGPFTPAGHPRLADGRRPVPPARLFDDGRGRHRDPDDDRGARPRPAPPAGLHPRRRRRPQRPVVPASTELGPQRGRGAAFANGYVGRRGAQRVASRWPGLTPADVDVAELYDPFSFEIIRQLEAFGFCGDGEGGAFVMDGTIGPGGRTADHDRRRVDVVQSRRA